MLRFKLNIEKTIQAIDYIARIHPHITQYYVGKILFFADREHLLDYGRPITGDRYVAMRHGPVPSTVRDMLKTESDEPDQILVQIQNRLRIERSENIQHISSKEVDDLPELSGSDKEYIADAVEKYADMDFGKLKDLSHQDAAYENAWAKDGNANDIDIQDWLNALENPEGAKNQLLESNHAVVN